MVMTQYLFFKNRIVSVYRSSDRFMKKQKSLCTTCKPLISLASKAKVLRGI
jgi:hypothetical protein